MWIQIKNKEEAKNLVQEMDILVNFKNKRKYEKELFDVLVGSDLPVTRIEFLSGGDKELNSKKLLEYLSGEIAGTPDVFEKTDLDMIWDRQEIGRKIRMVLHQGITNEKLLRKLRIILLDGDEWDIIDILRIFSMFNIKNPSDMTELMLIGLWIPPTKDIYPITNTYVLLKAGIKIENIKRLSEIIQKAKTENLEIIRKTIGFNDIPSLIRLESVLQKETPTQLRQKVKELTEAGYQKSYIVTLLSRSYL